MRLCIPETFGSRGAGLGNELFPWAKAFLASQALGARMFHPAWGLNPRHYYRDFSTSRLDWLVQRAIKTVMPVVRFEEADYQATGKGDFEDAILHFATNELHHRHGYVLSVGGMWGGFCAIRKARTFILAELLKARQAVENVHSVMRQVPQNKILVGVHIRRGDFQNTGCISDFRGRFNAALPLDWYLATCRSLKREFVNNIQFLLLTDAASLEVKPFIDEFSPLTTFHLQHTACSDLLLLALSDCLVCSVSSYSMWGAFLSGAPYLWFSPNVQEHGDYGSLWGHEASQQAPAGVTARNLDHAQKVDALSTEPYLDRGVLVDLSGTVPDEFFKRLAFGQCGRLIERDLIFYGVTRLPEMRGMVP